MLATHRHIGPRFVCIPCSLAHMAVQPPHVCHRHRDWAVSTGSHVQHRDTAQAPPHLGALIFLVEYRSRLKTIENIGGNFP